MESSNFSGSIFMKKNFSITWLGHGTFLLTSPSGIRILIDPWLSGNPACPNEWKRIRQASCILVTHAHSDHIGDLLQAARDTGAVVVGIVELCQWLESRGLQHVYPMNKGGMFTNEDVQVTMVHAEHSSSVFEDRSVTYLGDPVGYVLKFRDGPCLYFAGDTDVFGDMALIKKMHAPQIAFLPIGGRFTMGPDGAAVACELLGVNQVVPMHFGTFPSLPGHPDRLRELVTPKGIDLLDLRPGETAG